MIKYADGECDKCGCLEAQVLSKKGRIMRCKCTKCGHKYTAIIMVSSTTKIIVFILRILNFLIMIGLIGLAFLLWSVNWWLSLASSLVAVGLTLGVDWLITLPLEKGSYKRLWEIFKNET